MINIMLESQVTIPVEMDKEEVGRLFENYNLNSAAVIDKNEKLVGMITSDDILTVLKEEAEEDTLRLAGVGDEEITDGVLVKTKRRFNWLLLNLFTAFLATWCISLFGATIEQMVVLAFLMPIVASMGGNAGMQTLAVTVRSLATNDLTKNNFSQNILKEFNIGVLNGIIFAIISAVVVQFWFNDTTLSLIISNSMVLNMIVAGLFGILVPVSLKKINIDEGIRSIYRKPFLDESLNEAYKVVIDLCYVVDEKLGIILNVEVDRMAAFRQLKEDILTALDLSLIHI